MSIEKHFIEPHILTREMYYKIRDEITLGNYKPRCFHEYQKNKLNNIYQTLAYGYGAVIVGVAATLYFGYAPEVMPFMFLFAIGAIVGTVQFFTEGIYFIKYIKQSKAYSARLKFAIQQSGYDITVRDEDYQKFLTDFNNISFSEKFKNWKKQNS